MRERVVGRASVLEVPQPLRIVVGVITAMFPAVTVALATLFLGERMRSSQLVGVVASLTAVVLMTLG